MISAALSTGPCIDGEHLCDEHQRENDDMERAESTPTQSSVTSMEGVRRRAPKLDRHAIEQVVRSGKRLLVQGAMGIHASDGLSGKVAAVSEIGRASCRERV